MDNLMYIRHGFYPDTIPKRRRSVTGVLLIVYFILLSVGCFVVENVTLYLVISIAVHFFATALGELINRLCLIPEELKHLKSRYKNSYSRLLKSLDLIFVLLICTASFAVLVFMYFYYQELPWKLYLNNSGQYSGLIVIILLPVCCFLLHQIFKLDHFPLNVSLAIENLKVDYGSGMACSYMHGYLNLILPNTGGEDKDLHELLQKFEANEGIQFPVYKLFILIPLSGYCPPSLENSNNPMIEESKSLEEKALSVAGVKNRIYKNSIYKINRPGPKKEKVYVCAEYATPVKTFYNVLRTSSAYAESYKLQKEEIIHQFYVTLKTLLQENRDCTHLCELIYYDDEVVNENGEVTYRDVGHILLHRIDELKIT